MQIEFGTFLLNLAQNIALAAIVLVTLPQLRARAIPFGKHGSDASLGLVFGAVIVLNMMNPVHIAPGVFIDGRSALMTLAGFVGGPIAAVVAAIISDTYRLWLGGAGAIVGAVNVVVAGAIGVCG